MAAGQKSLTQPPQNLKEAIDWVLRVSGRDGFGGDGTDLLAAVLTASLKKTPHGGNDDVRNILAAIENDGRNSAPTGPIKQLGDALKTFIGYKSSGSRSGSNDKIEIDGSGIVKSGEVKHNSTPSAYVSAYTGAWFTDVNNGSEENQTTNKKKALQNFFTAIEKIYEGLTELYYNCKNGWSKKRLNGSSNALKKFMNDNGFRNTQLNTGMKGEEIISQALQSLTEFSTAHSAAGSNPSLDAFRYQLEQNAISTPSTFPLSALYILATYAYVQSTSPATPSFHGYSGLTALAGGAYAFNLGGLGTFMSALLA